MDIGSVASTTGPSILPVGAQQSPPAYVLDSGSGFASGSASTPAQTQAPVPTNQARIADPLLQSLQSLNVGSAGDNDALGQDMGQFMSTLFDAVHGAGSPSGASSSFSNGLAALIAQTSAGTVPADLQSAFDTVASGLQGSGGGTNASLQGFLTQLQSNLGYGAGAGAGSLATGNLLSSSA